MEPWELSSVLRLAQGLKVLRTLALLGLIGSDLRCSVCCRAQISAGDQARVWRWPEPCHWILPLSRPLQNISQTLSPCTVHCEFMRTS